MPLSRDDIRTLILRALSDKERGLGNLNVTVTDDALAFLVEACDGDARRALTALEAAAGHVGAGGTITVDVARDALQLRFARYDKGGEETYNMLSAFHKSLRGSDPQAALYWMARLLDVLREQMFGELNEAQIGYVDDVLEAGRHLLAGRPPLRAASGLLAARLAQRAIVLFTWSSVNRITFAAATAAPKMPNTGPGWKPRAITVGMKSAAMRSATS